MEVIQKSMVRSLSRCGKKNKTILLEASVSNLNPKNMKRRFSYRPNRKNDTDGKSSIDEQDFPWYQKAWIEEMELRISGKVPFTEPLEQSSRISRIIFGNFYRASIPSSTSFIQRYLLFPFIIKPQKSDGIDSTNAKNWASNKPHAVIADGAAMYSVPGSLLHLSRCCKEANVPLFVVNDPRTWGHNTHSDVTLAARDLRKSVKNHFIQNALKIKQSSSFERGRKLGKVETKLGYELREASDKTMKSILEAKKSLEAKDWSTLDEQTLKHEFMKRKLISVRKMKGDNEEEEIYTCTEGMRTICRKFLQEQDQNNIKKELNSAKIDKVEPAENENMEA